MLVSLYSFAGLKEKIRFFGTFALFFSKSIDFANGLWYNIDTNLFWITV